jgi:sarcosine oxidase subunit gamma
MSSGISTALSSDYEPGLQVSGASGEIGVTLAEIRGRQLIQVSAWPDSFAALSDLLRDRILCPLPEKPGTATSGGGVTALWTQPGTALLVTDHVPLLERLDGQIPAALGSLTELTAARTIINLSGPAAAWTLAKIVAVDLDPEAAVPGSCFTTGAHDLALLIHVKEAQEKAGKGTDARSFDIYVMRSFALSFWEGLCEAALESGYRIAG